MTVIQSVKQSTDEMCSMCLFTVCVLCCKKCVDEFVMFFLSVLCSAHQLLTLQRTEHDQSMLLSQQ